MRVEDKSAYQVALESKEYFRRMFDLSIDKDRMMSMMPGMIKFLAVRPDRKEYILNFMPPMMDSIGLKPTPDLLVEMMPYVVSAIDDRPGLGDIVFNDVMPDMLGTFGLKMDSGTMKKVMPQMMGLMVRHPGLIPAMMRAMPKLMK